MERIIKKKLYISSIHESTKNKYGFMNIYKFIKFSLFLTLIGLTSCKNEIIEQKPFEFEHIPLNQKIKKSLDDEYLSNLQFSEQEKNFLRKIYGQRNFKSFWINDSTLTLDGHELVKHIHHKLAFGIPDSRDYATLQSQDNFIQQELKLTVTLSEMLSDLSVGFLLKDSIGYKPISMSDVDQFLEFYTEKSEHDFNEAFWNCGPVDSNYQTLAKFLFTEYSKGNLDRTSYSIKVTKGDSLKTIEESKIALKNKGYLSDVEADSTTLALAIMSFQKDNQLNSDGLIGKLTALTLNESSWDRVNRIALEMERIRQAKVYPEKYLLINLPEYMLRLYINDSLKSEHNIIIGKLGHETPQLNASVKKIIVFPFWKVPYSIASKEILPAAQKNSNYFAKHNYKVYKKDVEVNPLTVNWKKIKENSFPYIVKQDPGPKNSLGMIKFDMPNNQSIYIHDTPSKGLFSTKTRSYSHGCIRCNNPFDLAKAILDRDEVNEKFNPMNADSLDSIVARGKNYEIKLMNFIPVIMEYRTVVVEENEVKIFTDIYGREAKYIELFNGAKKMWEAFGV